MAHPHASAIVELLTGNLGLSRHQSRHLAAELATIEGGVPDTFKLTLTDRKGARWQITSNDMPGSGVVFPASWDLCVIPTDPFCEQADLIRSQLLNRTLADLANPRRIAS